MEKPKVLNGMKLEPISKGIKSSIKTERTGGKKIIGDIIERTWHGNNSNLDKNPKIKLESKKLVIKLETNGREKRKILLKLESASSSVNPDNCILISELLKEFFKPS